LTKITIAAAQTIPVKGDVQKNIEAHEKLIIKAASKNADLIVFPELSLTGYEPAISRDLSFTVFDDRIQSIFSLSEKHGMMVIAGAPIRIETNLYIGSFIVFPDNTASIYLKHHLHPGEEKFFQPGFFIPKIQIGSEKASLAICADICNKDHAKEAAESKSTLYLASVFISPERYKKETGLLQSYARKYKMAILMSNYGGESGGREAAGKKNN
jgi:predicted amidohydrolase